MLFCCICQSSIYTAAVSKYLHITALCKAISEMASSVVEACPVAFAYFIPWRISTMHYFLILLPGYSLAIVLRTSVLVLLKYGVFLIYIYPQVSLFFLVSGFFSAFFWSQMIHDYWWAFTFREDLSAFCTAENMTMADTRQKLLVDVLLVEGCEFFYFCYFFIFIASIEQWKLSCPAALCCSFITEMQDDAFHCDSDNWKLQNILEALMMKVNFQEK